MNRLTILLYLLCFMLSMFLSACNKQDRKAVINYEHKFRKPASQEQQASAGYIDLSDGQKVNYDLPIPGKF